MERILGTRCEQEIGLDTHTHTSTRIHTHTHVQAKENAALTHHKHLQLQHLLICTSFTMTDVCVRARVCACVRVCDIGIDY